ncbi:hypothetical protein [Flavobacterium dankookense]|uniref:Uncharacterized protein n=1 Tax=Flavobacterium dankookense TaxID=706186 RepID=A0A4V3CRZ6_9FLAO|nr:hypothetical protein [Flavobacterium dankookense]TDP58642.1 hypothetical protein BC748_1867 [Flavobacterium dankookense]
MFKYKSTPVILLILISLFFTFIYFVNKSSNVEVKKNKELMKNNIEFSGIITNINISNNHAFGIMQLKIDKTNKAKFNPIADDKLFPYAINDSIAEIYHFIPLELKKGYKAIIKSNSKIISFYDKDKFLFEWEISIISSETDKKFVKENTIIK